MRRELAGRGQAHAQALRQLDLCADGDSHERRDGCIRAALTEQRSLELGVGPVEGLVAPIEPAAGLGDVGQKRQRDRPQQGDVSLARVRGGVDRSRRLAAQLLEHDARVGERAQPLGTRVHV